MAGLVEKFAFARTSWAFVFGLALLIGGWVAADLITGFDTTTDGGHFNILNFVLSVEASLSMPILYMGIEMAAKRDRRKLDEVLHTTRKLIVSVSGIAEDVEEIEEKLEGEV